MSDSSSPLPPEINGVLLEDIEAAVNEHMAKVDEAFWDMDGEMVTESFGPYCGCTTCVIREVLIAGFRAAGFRG